MPLLLVLAALLLAGCGEDAPMRDRPAAPTQDPAADSGSPGVAVPDGGVSAGHGADARRDTVTVPGGDESPPIAIIRLVPGAAARPVVHRSPVRSRRGPPVRLARPEVRATALIRDTDGGTGRVRVTVRYEAICARESRRRTVHRPPPQIERIRLAPGTRAPARRIRRANVSLPRRCRVTGEVFADATNALGLESFSDPIRFVYR